MGLLLLAKVEECEEGCAGWRGEGRGEGGAEEGWGKRGVGQVRVRQERGGAGEGEAGERWGRGRG